MVLQRILEILAYLATNHTSVANMLFFFDQSIVSQAVSATLENKKDKGKEKIEEGGTTQDGDIPLILFLKLLNRPIFLHSTSHLEQVEWNFCSINFFFNSLVLLFSQSLSQCSKIKFVLQLKLPHHFFEVF